jgi:branched-chain amino acid transport system permease protein
LSTRAETARGARGPGEGLLGLLLRPGVGLAALLIAFAIFSYEIAHGTAYTQSLFTVAAVYAILAVSLDLVAGVVGLYSLCHAGLFAIGAYATTLLATEHGWSVWALLPVVVIGVGVVGLFIGLLSLRVSGLYFAITTFVFTLLVVALLTDLRFTGGLQGLIGPLFPEFSPSLEWLGAPLVWATMICLLVCVLISWAIRRSPFYSVLLAIRDAEPLAAAAGARTSMIKVAMFGLSAAMAGLAGWVFCFQGFISPSQFEWTLSVNILVMVLLGGINSLWGPIIGAAFISIFPDYVNIEPFWQEVLFGALLLVVIVAAPRGFVGLLAAGARRAAAKLGLPADLLARREPEQPGGATRVTEQIASGNGGGPAIECRDVSFGYGTGVLALDGVDFVAKRGTIHGLIGPNGSGKSTLVDLIAGRIQPQEGTIAVNGTRMDGMRAPSRARHGLMRTFQTAVMVDDLSARDNVLVGLYSRVPRLGLRAGVWPALPTARRDGVRMRALAGDALDFAGVNGWSDAKVGDVPHGVEQLTQLAAACAPGPNVLVLDEPVAGLSTAETERVRERLAELKEAGMTILLIEHQPSFVFDLSDEVTVLNAGKVVASGPSAEVREDRRVREVYLGL